MIVHDLRNPLAVISGHIDIVLSQEENLARNQIDSLEIGFRYCKELNQMIEELLEIYKMEEGNLKLNIETVNLKSLIEDCVEPFLIKAEKKHIDLLFDRLDRDLLIPVDRSLVKRTLGNLLNNAIRHTPSQGKIEVIAQPDQTNGNLHIDVRDTGDGLAPENHQKIFDKFEQVNLAKSRVVVGASGLGLAFCKLAVEAHGGRIWVESEGEGKGAKFQFTLPVKKNRTTL